MNNKPDMNGFTLVELSIVMIIIGLLIGGVLKGQELIDNARVSATISLAKQVIVAQNNFEAAYHSIPGDITSATTLVPGCNAAALCIDGNGNQTVGTKDDFPWWHIAYEMNSENTQFWKHLAMADMIGGIDPLASQPEWGKSHLQGKLPGGFYVRSAVSRASGGFERMTNLVLISRVNVDGTWNCGVHVNNPDVCSVKPVQAFKIDKKMDDGVADQGLVGAISRGYGNGCGTPNNGINSANGYATSVTQSSCDMIFAIK